MDIWEALLMTILLPPALAIGMCWAGLIALTACKVASSLMRDTDR